MTAIKAKLVYMFLISAFRSYFIFATFRHISRSETAHLTPVIILNVSNSCKEYFVEWKQIKLTTAPTQNFECLVAKHVDGCTWLEHFFLTCTHLSVDAADGISSKNTLGQEQTFGCKLFSKLVFLVGLLTDWVNWVLPFLGRDYKLIILLRHTQLYIDMHNNTFPANLVSYLPYPYSCIWISWLYRGVFHQ